MVIEGMIIAGFAVQAAHGIIFIRPEYENAARILERAGINIRSAEFWQGGFDVLTSALERLEALDVVVAN